MLLGRNSRRPPPRTTCNIKRDMNLNVTADIGMWVGDGRPDKSINCYQFSDRTGGAEVVVGVGGCEKYGRPICPGIGVA